MNRRGLGLGGEGLYGKEDEERNIGKEGMGCWGRIGREKMHSPPKREKVERSKENINKYM
jgi:hypothetical protein